MPPARLFAAFTARPWLAVLRRRSPEGGAERVRVLVCAPSNAAVDMICQRLLMRGGVRASILLRVNSFSRPKDGIPDILKASCLWDDAQAGPPLQSFSFRLNFVIFVSRFSPLALCFQGQDSSRASSKRRRW